MESAVRVAEELAKQLDPECLLAWDAGLLTVLERALIDARNEGLRARLPKDPRAVGTEEKMPHELLEEVRELVDSLEEKIMEGDDAAEIAETSIAATLLLLLLGERCKEIEKEAEAP